MTSNGPEEQDAANGGPDDSGVVHSQIVSCVHNVEILAGSRIVGTRHDTIGIPPVGNAIRGIRMVLDVSRREAQSVTCHDGRLMGEQRLDDGLAASWNYWSTCLSYMFPTQRNMRTLVRAAPPGKPSSWCRSPSF